MKMRIEYLKSKWVVKWLEIYRIREKEFVVQCSNWFSTEEEAEDFVRHFREREPVNKDLRV